MIQQTIAYNTSYNHVRISKMNSKKIFFLNYELVEIIIITKMKNLRNVISTVIDKTLKPFPNFCTRVSCNWIFYKRPNFEHLTSNLSHI